MTRSSSPSSDVLWSAVCPLPAAMAFPSLAMLMSRPCMPSSSSVSNTRCRRSSRLGRCCSGTTWRCYTAELASRTHQIIAVISSDYGCAMTRRSRAGQFLVSCRLRSRMPLSTRVGRNCGLSSRSAIGSISATSSAPVATVSLGCIVIRSDQAGGWRLKAETMSSIWGDFGFSWVFLRSCIMALWHSGVWSCR